MINPDEEWNAREYRDRIIELEKYGLEVEQRKRNLETRVEAVESEHNELKSWADSMLQKIEVLETQIAAKDTLILKLEERERLLESRAEKAEHERDELRTIIAKCCNVLPNGAYCSPDASIEFMRYVPDEIVAVTTQMRKALEAAEVREQALQQRLEAKP